MRILPVLLAAVVLSVASSASAISLSIDGASCGSCEGADLMLNIVADATGFNVTLTIDSTDYVGPKDGLVEVGFGGISNWTSVSLVSSPLTSTVAWSPPVAANTSSAGLCATGTTTDKICTDGFVDITTTPGVYTWTFHVTGGTVASSVTGLHIGGQYADLADLSSRRGPRGHIISEMGPAIPEPSAAMLFGLGALLVSRVPRRSR